MLLYTILFESISIGVMESGSINLCINGEHEHHFLIQHVHH